MQTLVAGRSLPTPAMLDGESITWSVDVIMLRLYQPSHHCMCGLVKLAKLKFHEIVHNYARLKSTCLFEFCGA